MDDMRFRCFCCVATGLGEVKELQLKVITALVAGQDNFAFLPTGCGKSLAMLCMSTTTLRSSLSVGRLTKINSDCCNSFHEAR